MKRNRRFEAIPLAEVVDKLLDETAVRRVEKVAKKEEPYALLSEDELSKPQPARNAAPRR